MNAIFQKFRIAPALALIATLFYFCSLRAQGEVAATYVQPPTASGYSIFGVGMGIDDGFVFDNRLAQTFTVLAAGPLQSISFSGHTWKRTETPLKLSLTEINEGLPGTVLATAFIANSTFGEFNAPPGSPPAFTHVITDFDTTPFLEAGTKYALTFSSDTPDANFGIYVGRSSNESYAGGELIDFNRDGAYEVDQSSQDLFFEVATGFSTPTMSITTAESEISLEFTGVIQSSTDLTNWTDLDPQPTSPWAIIGSPSKVFYRSRQE